MNLRFEETNVDVSNPFLTETEFTESIDTNLDLTEAKAVIRQMARALLDATRLRGLTASLNDPLALHGEKEDCRQQYLEIEAKVKAAIEVSRRFLK